jgi:diguanylate cyclase (GGDEF)-like protein
MPAMAARLSRPADPMAELARLREQLARLEAENARLRADRAAFELLCHEDPLTGVLNRRGFERDLGRAIAYADRYATPAALLLLDLDGFKAINDRHGHAAGDLALRHAADILRGNLRTSDFLGRIGGDEFAILLWHVTAAVALRKADALEAALADQPLAVDGEELRVEGSIGATSLRPGDDASAVLRRADRAMYSRKAGRARNRADAQAMMSGVS